MALVQISYGKLPESLVRALLPTFLLTPFLVQTVTYSKMFLFYNIPLNSFDFPTSKPKIKKKQVSSTHNRGQSSNQTCDH